MSMTIIKESNIFTAQIYISHVVNYMYTLSNHPENITLILQIKKHSSVKKYIDIMF